MSKCSVRWHYISFNQVKPCKWVRKSEWDKISDWHIQKYINILSERWLMPQPRRLWVVFPWWRQRLDPGTRRYHVCSIFAHRGCHHWTLQHFCFARFGPPDWKKNTWDWSRENIFFHLFSELLLVERNCTSPPLYQIFIRYITNNKEADNDWFRLESNKEGTRWFGKCWHYHNQVHIMSYISNELFFFSSFCLGPGGKVTPSLMYQASRRRFL